MRKSALAFLFAGMLLCPRAYSDDNPATQASTKPGPGMAEWRDLLQQYGTIYSLYFTVEGDQFEIGPGTAPTHFMVPYFVKPPTEFKDRDDFLSHLRQWLPEADVQIDDTVPSVVHIREKALAKRGPLVLDEKITLTFDGSVADLLAELVKQSNGSLLENRGGAGGVVPYDQRVHTAVTAKDVTYRTLLSQAIPPNNNRIIWTADVIKRDGHSVTFFRLGSVKSPFYMRGMARLTHTDTLPSSPSTKP